MMISPGRARVKRHQSERLQVDQQHEGARLYHRGASVRHLVCFAATVLLNGSNPGRARAEGEEMTFKHGIELASSLSYSLVLFSGPWRLLLTSPRCQEHFFEGCVRADSTDQKGGVAEFLVCYIDWSRRHAGRGSIFDFNLAD
jgi:hypothetical protein